MADRTGKQKLNGHIAVSSAFLLLALAGWGTLGYTARSAAERQTELAAELRRMRSEQEDLRAERDRLAAEQRNRVSQAAEVAYLTNRVAALEAEGRTLAQDRDQARAELAGVQQQLAAAQERLSQPAEADNASATGATTRSAGRRSFRPRTRSR